MIYTDEEIERVAEVTVKALEKCRNDRDATAFVGSVLALWLPRGVQLLERIAVALEAKA